MAKVYKTAVKPREKLSKPELARLRLDAATKGNLGQRLASAHVTMPTLRFLGGWDGIERREP